MSMMSTRKSALYLFIFIIYVIIKDIGFFLKGICV